jgi:lipopolysaccharide/colanic/teichoic acid biosynthesis glycosyltransferase
MKDIIKRLFDVLGGTLVLLFLLPFLLVLGIWVKIDSPGRIFFLQRRVGKNLQEFRIVKFRTMYERDPDNIDQHAEKPLTNNYDPRVTNTGRFLRRTSLDELPQLWNILMGDMSVVGPRPIIPEQLEAIPQQYMSRFQVRPGLTGLSQIRGRRGLDWIAWLQADTEYVDNSNFLYDLILIVQTIYVVFTGRGLYSSNNRSWRDVRDEMRAERQKQ